MARPEIDLVIRQAVFPPPRRVAILGLSNNPGRPSNEVAGALLHWGYQIIPVNPGCSHILGLKCYASLADVDGPIDIVNVFRRSEHVRDHQNDMLTAAPRVIWLQDGVSDVAVAKAAEAAGILMVQDDCIARRIAQWQSSTT